MSTLPGVKQLDQFLELNIKDVYPNPNQPRKNFSEIEELSKTIKYYGLIHPITVVKDNEKYMIVSGERRYKAHLLINAKTIKAHILDIDDLQLRELVLIENIQRDDLTDFEKAKYIGSLWATGLYKKKQHLSTALGKSPSYISKCFSCLKLDPTIIDSLEKDLVDMPLSVLEEISRVKDKNLQCEIYDKYVLKEITRDEIKDYELEKFPAGKKEEIQKQEEVNNNIYISYGFGTQNELGTYIAICDGVFTGTIKIEDNKDLIKHSNNRNYKITIEEIDSEKVIEDDEVIQEQNIKPPVETVSIIRADMKESFLEIPAFIHHKLENGIEYKLIINTPDKKQIETTAYRRGGSKNSCLEIPNNIFEKLEVNIKYKIFISEKSLKDEEVRSELLIEKEIKLIEVFESDVYIEYIDFDSDTFSHNKARNLIKSSSTKAINYTIHGGSEKACNFINKMPHRSQMNGQLILKEKDKK